MKVQRLRVRFSRGEEVKFITHLDLMRVWERALSRAKIDVAYSEGFTPHAQLSLAAPLAVGVTSEAELLDVFLASRVTTLHFTREVSAQLPAGIAVLETREVGLRGPSLQSELRGAEYRVRLSGPLAVGDLQKAIKSFLTAESMPWEQLRDKQVRKYDIRALVQDVWQELCDNGTLVLGMRLQTDSSGSGRPEQVTAAMGLPEPLSIHRTKLILAESSPTHEAWRRQGRFA
ncbi:MAG: TIGR03936 family radical SAM-associated protein [Dehalococcoidia bacterium]